MTRKQFFSISGRVDVASIAAESTGDLVNVDKTEKIERVSSFSNSNSTAAVFVDAKKSAKVFSEISPTTGLCFTTPALKNHLPEGTPLLLVDHPKAAFARLAASLYVEKGFGSKEPQFEFGQNCQIHSSAVIGDGAKLGDEVSIGPQAVIGCGVEIGTKSIVEPCASISHSIIGKGVRIGAGARLGGVGFGIIPTSSGVQRIPHLGSVIISDHVEIDSNCTIDRGVLDDTVIGCRTQLDCLVHIAHNVVIGEDCVIAAQTGISGSVRVGDRVMLGGQIGIADHVEIGNDVQIAGGSGIMRDIKPGERWGGYPAMPVRKWLREVALAEERASKKGK